MRASDIGQQSGKTQSYGDTCTSLEPSIGTGLAPSTARFFDAVLPQCLRLVDFGAYLGAAALHAASHNVDVFAFEPSPFNHELLTRNVAARPDLAARIRLYRHGLGDADCYTPIYAKGNPDPGASIFRAVERDGIVCNRQEAIVPLRNAGSVLREVGIDGSTLLNVDIAGSEFRMLPVIADLLMERKPWLLVSFHPFNLVTSGDPYRTALLRLRSSLETAEALAPYRFIHVHDDAEGWCTIAPTARMDFLRHYLLSAKKLPGIASPQYGFVHAIGFSDHMLPDAAASE